MYSVATYRTSLDNNAEDLSSQNFFTQNREEDLFRWRHLIHLDQKHLYCGLCGKPLKICGGGKGENMQRLHFRHNFKQDAECCGYREEANSLSRRQIELKKFANKEEGDLHKHLKFLIANTLKKYGAETKIERYIVDEQDHSDRRRPDIRAIFPNKDIAIEVQITSTFMDVILGREDFYASHNMFLLWVMNEFRPDLFHQKDIIYSTKSQAFILDEEAQKRTEDEGKLYLKCYYKSYYCNYRGEIVEHTTFQHKLITYDELIFDEKDYSVYYFDVQKNKQQCEIEQKVIKERIQKEQEQRRNEQEAIRIKREEEEREAQRLHQLEQMKWQEEQERLQNEEEERKQKMEAERKEQQRLNDIKQAQLSKIADYYRDSVSLENYWQYYQQLSDEERGFADEEIHNIIIKSVYHNYAFYGDKYIYDKKITELYYFLLKHNYPFDWKQFENIPLAYFKYSYYELNMTLYEYITANLYANHNYHLPDNEKYLSKIIKKFEDIIVESKSRDKYYDYAASFRDIDMIILCFERIHDSSLGQDSDIYRLIYKNKDTMRHLFSIYLGELVGKDFDKDRYYYPFYDQIASSPYCHLLKRMILCRSKFFHDHGLVPNLVISQKEIEKKISNCGITPNYDLDALMPIIFPDIQWALQQTLF